MFTGIILAIGKISRMTPRGGDMRFEIHTGKLSLENSHIGDSIAVNGVCLTAIELGTHYFVADVSNETLSCTCLANAQVDMPVNLELALTPTSRLGGHIVSGHVDGIGTITERHNDGRSVRFTVKVPESLAKYIAEKGSICINGISLTVNRVDGLYFGVNIVPHTLHETTLNTAMIGTNVNLEVDILARYLERLMNHQTTSHPSNTVTMDLLHSSGFLTK
jgi:riboflavin synthase